jgi:dTDP-D-glucose 4,6-dehydratase
VDICHTEAITALFEQNDIDGVINFAAESHVDRSMELRMKYFRKGNPEAVGLLFYLIS